MKQEKDRVRWERARTNAQNAAQKTEHSSELEQRLCKREQEEMKLGREDEADYPGLASLFKEFGLYPKINVELLKSVKLRNTIIRNVSRKFQDSYQIDNGSKGERLLKAYSTGNMT